MDRIDSRLSGRVALVTGAASGLGKATALRLAQSDAAVAVNYSRNQTGAEAVAGMITEMGGRAVAIRADVADKAAVDAMVANVVAQLGGCHIVVANAAYSEDATLFELTLEQWNRMFDVVLKGTFLCAKAAIPHMLDAEWGRIITISSDAGKKGGQATGPHYSASKAGVLGLMMGLARQLASMNITVNDVCPMDIPVERWEGRSQERLDAILAGVPRGRFGSPADIGAAIAFLASDEAAHVNGTSIDVSGGAILL